MDGTSRTVVSTDLYYATAITLDYSTQTLYWVAWYNRTASYRVESSDTDGSNRQTLSSIYSSSSTSLHFYRGSVYYLYNYRIRSLSTVNGNVTQLFVIPSCWYPYDLKIVSVEQQLPGAIIIFVQYDSCTSCKIDVYSCESLW